MKVKLIEREGNFTPFDITLTVEELSELRALYCRMNLSSHTVEYHTRMGEIDPDATRAVWIKLDEYIRDNNLWAALHRKAEDGRNG